MGLDDLSVAVLEHERARSVEDAGRAAGDGRGMLARGDPQPGRLGHGQADRGLADEPAEQPDGVRAAAHAGEGEVGQPPSTARDWAAASSPIRRWRSRTIVG